MNAKGFTLFEFCAVIILTVMLLGLTLINFINSIEKAKAELAINSLMSIRYAQTWYQGKNGKFSNNLNELDNWGLAKEQLSKDNDWSYSILSAENSEFVAQALRSKGPYAGQSILLDEKGNISVSQKTVPWERE
jgi:type II secretory pathway pseudopilin PulG